MSSEPPPEASPAANPTSTPPANSTPTATPPATTSASTSTGPVPDDPRVRFLRACDRCRIRKIKCTNENPCARCVSAGATCSFSETGAPPSRTVLSSNERGDEPERPRRKRSTAPDAPAPKRRMCNLAPTPVLGPDMTQHFFTSRHGYPHHAGSMSGLPLLEVTRKLESETPPTSARAEPDWQWLQGLLGGTGAGGSPRATARGVPEDVEFFPGREFAPDRSRDDLISSIPQTIPHDLMIELLRIFFTTIHPVWPIVHIPTFFMDLYRWDDHDFAAIVVAMCMLASRYTDDPRVRSDPEKPTSAGVHYYELFSRLRQEAGHGGSNPVYAVQSLFFASMFHCVDNVPHPIAHALFAEAQARCFDAGIHRSIPATVSDEVGHEMRSRTTFALFIWDKQISAFCGRPHLLQLWDIDVRLPEPFDESDSWVPPDWPSGNDRAYIATFKQQILVSAVLESVFRAYSHRPIWDASEFLTELCRASRHDPDGCNLLDRSSASLEKWRSGAPQEYAATPKERAKTDTYSVASEHVALVDQTVKMLIASRHLQLDSMMPERKDKAKLERHRGALIVAARDLVAIIVQLGASSLMSKCDILIAYRLLLTGRILLAVVLSARSHGNTAQAEEATRILQATSVVLRHFVLVFPAALGAAEVLDETIRVCRVPHTPAAPQSQFAWHRPITGDRTSASPKTAVPKESVAMSTDVGSTGSSAAPPQLTGAASQLPLGMSPMAGLFGSNIPAVFPDADGQGSPDFSWLLPGPGGDGGLPASFNMI